MHFRPWPLVLLSFLSIPPAALADPAAPPPSREQSAVDGVHVQPRRDTFMPNSAAEDELQRRITDFNQKQGGVEAEFDRKLRICRGC
ncbi:exported hypothetical protein [Bradyrhizobium sp. STM 3843]|uniref:hypothetical protein n=1 Tax=Bradyrhizobium sp. STM 3843 TaxID=551947 RepID=UPI0002403103|nr:hypothetical protein [Bradyrhizobium sp. STM 3843]CCE10681.1 exported hypothetical protein [Bradyrhizobium sp. STM 3843]